MPSDLEILKNFRNYFGKIVNNTYAVYEIKRIKKKEIDSFILRDVIFQDNNLSHTEYLQIMKNINCILKNYSYDDDVCGYINELDQLYYELFGTKK